MFNWILNYLVSTMEELPIGRRVKTLITRIAKLVKKFLVRHPAFLILVLAVLVVYAIFNPDVLPNFVRPTHACRVVSSDADDLAGLDGDQITSIKQRRCKPQTAVAFEWYNWNPVTFEDRHITKNLVSANLLVNGSARLPSYNKTWFEYNLFGKANNTPWQETSLAFQDLFVPSACGFDTPSPAVTSPHEGRRGILLTTSTLRSNPRVLTHQQWLTCNMADPRDPSNKYCDWVRFQFFFPTDFPHKWCGDSTFWDRWSWNGTRRVYLTKGASDEGLRSAARNRFEGHNEKDVTEENWSRWTRDMPKLCGRQVRDEEKTPGEYKAITQWQEYGRIGSVWCDY